MKYRIAAVVLLGFASSSTIAATPTAMPKLPANLTAWDKTKGICALPEGLHIHNTAYVIRGFRNSEPMQIIVVTELNGTLISQFEGQYLEHTGTVSIINGTVKIKTNNADQWGHHYDLSLPEDKKAAQSRLRALIGVDESEYHKRCAGDVSASPNNKNTNGLVGLWSFDGPDMNWTQNKALDRSGQRNDGMLVNMPTTTSPTIGKIGQALNFNGVDDYVDAGAASNIQSLDQLSVSAWIYVTNYPDSGDSYVHAIVSTLDDSCCSSAKGWSFQIGNYNVAASKENLHFTFRKSDNSGWIESNDGSTELALNSWYHVVVTYDQANIKLHVNGVQDSTTAAIDGIRDGVALHIGRQPVASGSSPRNWEGKLDEVRIYNRALSQAEITQLYNQGR